MVSCIFRPRASSDVLQCCSIYLSKAIIRNRHINHFMLITICIFQFNCVAITHRIISEVFSCLCNRRVTSHCITPLAEHLKASFFTPLKVHKSLNGLKIVSQRFTKGSLKESWIILIETQSSSDTLHITSICHFTC